MARYREKDETDLAWNRIRRRLTREADTQIQNWRESYLNRILTVAWDRYSKELENGNGVELESAYEDRIIEDALRGRVGVDLGPLASNRNNVEAEA